MADLPWHFLREVDRQPEHRAPACPACTLQVAVPLVESPRAADLVPGGRRWPELRASDLWCPSCGHAWEEPNPWAVASAWWSAGAWEVRRG